MLRITLPPMAHPSPSHSWLHPTSAIVAGLDSTRHVVERYPNIDEITWVGAKSSALTAIETASFVSFDYDILRSARPAQPQVFSTSTILSYDGSLRADFAPQDLVIANGRVVLEPNRLSPTIRDLQQILGTEALDRSQLTDGLNGWVNEYSLTSRGAFRELLAAFGSLSVPQLAGHLQLPLGSASSLLLLDSIDSGDPLDLAFGGPQRDYGSFRRLHSALSPRNLRRLWQQVIQQFVSRRFEAVKGELRRRRALSQFRRLLVRALTRLRLRFQVRTHRGGDDLATHARVLNFGIRVGNPPPPAFDSRSDRTSRRGHTGHNQNGGFHESVFGCSHAAGVPRGLCVKRAQSSCQT